MKRTTLHALNPESARKRINAAKSNKPFMRVLLDRAHPGHQDALSDWTALHEMAFEGPAVRTSDLSGEGAGSVSEDSRRRPPAADMPVNRSGSQIGARQARSRDTNTPSRRSGISTRRSKATSRAEARRSEERFYPDPERQLEVDQSTITPFLRRRNESERAWLRRLMDAANGPRVSIERLAIIREAILREIGFYDLGSRSSSDLEAIGEAEWRVLAALQNVPVHGWDSALSMGKEARAEFEQRGTLGLLEVLGPDGNIYQRLGIIGENPVGDVLTTVDQRIRAMRIADPDAHISAILPAVALARPGRQGSTPARSPLATNVAPRVHQFIRSRSRAAAGTAIGVGLGYAGHEALDRRGRSDMDAAPQPPPLPGLEPPERPENDESFDEASIEVEVVPGFEAPRWDGPRVLIFPDVSEEILQTLITERREKQETRDQLDAIRDFFLNLHADWSHFAGGRSVGSVKDKPEFRIPGPGVAFPHPVTEKPGDSRPGSIYVDLTFETPNGFVHVQTVDIDRDGLPTERELRAARRIADLTGHPVYLVPKTWQLRDLEERSSDFIPIEVR